MWWLGKRHQDGTVKMAGHREGREVEFSLKELVKVEEASLVEIWSLEKVEERWVAVARVEVRWVMKGRALSGCTTTCEFATVAQGHFAKEVNE